jgi:hypothetical protein
MLAVSKWMHHMESSFARNIIVSEIHAILADALRPFPAKDILEHVVYKGRKPVGVPDLYDAQDVLTKTGFAKPN